MISVELSPEGRDYLSERGLDLNECEEMGITSNKDTIFFPYRVNGKLFRWKCRSMTDKKKQWMTPIMEKSLTEDKISFWNAQIWPTSDYLIITEGEFDAVA